LKKLILLSLILFVAGCATSTTHVGVIWGKTTGHVSSSDARKVDKFVTEFHSYLQDEHWEAAYGALDRRLQDVVGKTELKNSFAKIKQTYGIESGFSLSATDSTELLHKLSPMKSDDSKRSNSFDYYDSIVAKFVSRRTLTNLVYIIGVSRADSKADLKISSLQIFRENDATNRNTFSPVLSVSVALQKVVP